jgi:hypothetical protein
MKSERYIYTMLNLATCSIFFICAWTTYLQRPSMDKFGTGTSFVCTIPKIEHGVNRPLVNKTLGDYCKIFLFVDNSS